MFQNGSRKLISCFLEIKKKYNLKKNLKTRLCSRIEYLMIAELYSRYEEYYTERTVIERRD